MFVPAPNESNFAPVPAGTHLGICYRVIDLGTQKSEFNGETKMAHKVMISWEIPEEKMTDGRPFMISQTYSWSMHPKAKLRKDLEAWRGAAFTDKDFGQGGFDTKNLLEKPCTLSVLHTSKDGNTYANVASIGKAMKGVTVPQLSNPAVYLWLVPERWDAKVLASLSPNLQGKIMGSPEYIEMMNDIEGRSSSVDQHHYHEDNEELVPF